MTVTAGTAQAAPLAIVRRLTRSCDTMLPLTVHELKLWLGNMLHEAATKHQSAQVVELDSQKYSRPAPPGRIWPQPSKERA